MAQPGVPASEPPHPPQPPPSASLSGTHGFLRKLFGRQNGGTPPSAPADLRRGQQQDVDLNDTDKAGLMRRMSRKVVPGLPRAQTFKRQQSERRHNLAPVEPTPNERRAVSVDRRSREPRASSTSHSYINPRISAPGFLGSGQDRALEGFPSLPASPSGDELDKDKLARTVSKDDELTLADDAAVHDTFSTIETQSLTTSLYDAMIHDELERKWILNLSMHFRDRSKREKFFVTYREGDHIWRRVTISLDYRNAPLNSLEMDLIQTHYQRDKNAKIYEAIRESLADIQFYDTVTNLKLQTTDGRLHVHVVEDGNEIIAFPSVRQVQHLECRRIRERDIVFESHMSGFVYKVKVNGQTLIKKEIPSPDTVDEFLYEVNALNRLSYSHSVIHFHGVVVDDQDEHVKGLLISYAEQGALIDLLYEHCKEGGYDIPWRRREQWARQIVQGLSDIHESGFVQGDFTLSNIVIDEHGDAKIIDINRRGCPVGWEPPEATPLLDSNQRISMYIGVKSDLYQLGMVLWALATQEDEPESQGRPLILGPEVNIPDWYRQMAEICLSDDPRMRLQASSLLQMFPRSAALGQRGGLTSNPPISVDDGYSVQQYLVDGYLPDGRPQIKTVEPPSDWSYVSRAYTDASPGYEPTYMTRGRSPPSPIPSNYGRYNSPGGVYDVAAWAANRDIPSSYSDVGTDDIPADQTPIAEPSALIEPDPTLNPDPPTSESCEALPPSIVAEVSQITEKTDLPATGLEGVVAPGGPVETELIKENEPGAGTRDIDRTDHGSRGESSDVQKLNSSRDLTRQDDAEGGPGKEEALPVSDLNEEVISSAEEDRLIDNAQMIEPEAVIGTVDTSQQVREEVPRTDAEEPELGLDANEVQGTTAPDTLTTGTPPGITESVSAHGPVGDTQPASGRDESPRRQSAVEKEERPAYEGEDAGSSGGAHSPNGVETVHPIDNDDATQDEKTTGKEVGVLPTTYSLPVMTTTDTET